MTMFSPLLNWLDEMGAWGTFLKTILVILAAALAGITSLKSIEVIPRGWDCFKERNGHPVRIRKGQRHVSVSERPYKRYHRFNIIVPWIDTMRRFCTLEETRHLSTVKATVDNQTWEVDVTITISVIDGIKFLYVHSDPRSQIDARAMGIVCEALSASQPISQAEVELRLLNVLPTIAEYYGIKILQVTVKSMWQDGVMAQAAAQNHIADALGGNGKSTTP